MRPRTLLALLLLMGLAGCYVYPLPPDPPRAQDVRDLHPAMTKDLPPAMPGPPPGVVVVPPPVWYGPPPPPPRRYWYGYPPPPPRW